MALAILCTACSKETSCTTDTVNAANLKLTTTLDAFIKNGNKTNCEAYKSALNDMVEIIIDCPTVTGVTEKQLRDAIADLDCK